MEFVFKSLQLANILAGLLLARSAFPPCWRWLRHRHPGDQVPIHRFAVAALVLAVVPLLAFWQRLLDGMVLWLHPQFPAASALASMLALYVTQHLSLASLSRGGPSGTLHRQAVIAGAVLLVAVGPTAIEKRWPEGHLNEQGAVSE